ncbi:putative inactive leucine-rich repeat receptor kinase XIAO [Vitis vinifera]|uniref:Putative inactive leucine-rich repeat receptor kinase XIAO n=1 Tax=Vitis vinifera TaxID=29760 RepID=A0A438JD17_VITVI|nr:putative inactive leucine-rich repeat receptor kinase XIAO [Vitis vinifera]
MSTDKDYGNMHSGKDCGVGSCQGDHQRGCIEPEKVALLEFKQGLTDPSRRFSSWVGEDCCKWRGVVCSNRSGHVIKLTLRYLDGDGTEGKLGGKISPALLELKYLNYLDLSMNNFGGIPIPEFIGLLEKLRYLNLSGASFGGPIPPQLGNLSSLRYSHRSFPQWFSTPTIPHCSWLETLDLGFNDLGGFLPNSLGKLYNLKFLWLWDNSFVGSIPSSIGNLSYLEELYLSDNAMNGTIPEALGRLSNPEWIPPFKLSLLRIRSCQMGPKFPAWLRNQTELTDVVLNNAGSHTPYQSGAFAIMVIQCDEMYLYDNFFSGPIPLEFGDRMPMLTDLDLSSNALNGTIPLSFGKLNNLLTLVISNNHLSGGIPEFWNGLPYLYAIDMNNNNLSGELPSSMGSLRFLRFLMISNNHLSGQLPSALQNCTGIHTLDLGGNRFSGNVPAWIGERMPNLLILRLRSNLFHGSIPSQFGMASEIDSQRYEGELMVLRKGREDLYKSILYLVNSMDLSDNNLCGEVPEGVTNLSRLGTLNLSINHLTGKIPDNIGSLQGLETLDLSRNHLSGVIPPGMASLTSLNHLNLSYNNLSGRIPTGNQLQTLDDPSIYENNPALCGPPTTAKCPGDDQRPKTRSGDNVEDENENGDGFEMKWFYVSMGPGFAVGFWGVCVTLIVKNSWRHAYFRLVYDVKEWLLMVISLNVARLRRKLNLGSI